MYLMYGNRAKCIGCDYQVPNIVHYTWYNEKRVPIQFHHMLSILSAYKVLKPDIIYFHTDNEPIGEYWEQLKTIPSLKINHRKAPTSLFGEPLKKPAFYNSHSDVERIKVLMEFGGIYLDMDVFVIQSFDELRKYNCVMGSEEDSGRLCAAVVICEKSSAFLTLWINSYLDDYRVKKWGYNSGMVSTKMAKRYPHLIHIEPTRLLRPNYDELDWIFGEKKFNWSKKYTIHLWHSVFTESAFYKNIELDPNGIKYMNNTFGEMARTIYFGDSVLFPKNAN